MPSKWMNVVEVVDAADLAVRTACVLELLAESRPTPPFAGGAVEGAIAMLDDALSASALLTGSACEKRFSGNLNALCWATDSYVAKHRVLSPGDLCGDVERYLQQVIHQMRLIHAAMSDRSGGGPPGRPVECQRCEEMIAAESALAILRRFGGDTGPARGRHAAGLAVTPPSTGPRPSGPPPRSSAASRRRLTPARPTPVSAPAGSPDARRRRRRR